MVNAKSLSPPPIFVKHFFNVPTFFPFQGSPAPSGNRLEMIKIAKIAEGECNFESIVFNKKCGLFVVERNEKAAGIDLVKRTDEPQTCSSSGTRVPCTV